jgi:hypothetical protein
MIVARNAFFQITSLITMCYKRKRSYSCDWLPGTAAILVGEAMTDDINRSHHDDPHAPPGPHIVPAPPAPLIAKEIYLGDKPKSMPLYTDRFARSKFMRIANNDQLGAAFRLWLLAWGEKPAGSLPNDDRWLSDAAKIDRQRWSSEAEVVLHGFVACNDGRLYHPTICEIAKRRFAQLKGRQRGAALSRRRQEAKRIENRRKHISRRAASISTAPPHE